MEEHFNESQKDQNIFLPKINTTRTSQIYIKIIIRVKQ